MEMINIKIDNKDIKVAPGTTVLDAAKSVGINIPTLCYLHLHDFDITNKPAGCRICVVEVKGRRNLAPACATDCYEGMEVNTHIFVYSTAAKLFWNLYLVIIQQIALYAPKAGVANYKPLHRIWEYARLNTRENNRIIRKILHQQSYAMLTNASCAVAAK